MGVYNSLLLLKQRNIDIFAFSSKVADVGLVALAPVRCLVNRLAGQSSPANLFIKHLTGGKCVQIEQPGFPERSEPQKPPETFRSTQKSPEVSRSIRKPSEASRSFQKPPEVTRSIQKPSEVSRSPHKWSDWVPHASKRADTLGKRSCALH